MRASKGKAVVQMSCWKGLLANQIPDPFYQFSLDFLFDLIGVEVRWGIRSIVDAGLIGRLNS